MSNKTLTISIAAYNVEQYLACTLDSIVACESLPEIDVVVVNDGSQDGTLALANKYANLYPESIRVIDKLNGGYGSNINVSILEAAGRYYRLLDGDDWVDSKELDKLIKYLKSTAADMVVTKYSSVRGSDIKHISLEWPYDSKTYPICDRLDYHYAMHMLTFKTELLYNVLVNEPIIEHANYTDFEFNVKGITACKTVAYLDADVYQYRLGREGQSVELNSWFRNIDKACGVTLHVSDFYERVINDSQLFDDDVQNWALEQCVGSARYKCTLMQMMGGGHKTYERLSGFLYSLKETSPSVYFALLREKSNIVHLCSSYLYFLLCSLPLHAKAMLLSRNGR